MGFNYRILVVDEGLVMLRESLPDIIISDLKMPGMSFRRAQAILQGGGAIYENCGVDQSISASGARG
jgi:CheY-like chemotaxis protein